jgi:ubiquinone/menaquinone biosynthesis C-methylase UbiE
LPFRDAKFDAIYNFSVLTHLSEDLQIAWVRELQRVLKPGGLFACTTHGEAYRYLLVTDAERAAFDAGQLVVQGKYREGRKWFLAIHPESYVRDRLLAGFTDVRRRTASSEDGMLQDVWTARRPESTTVGSI